MIINPWMPPTPQPNTFDVVPRRKSITVFKAGGHWIFKHFFDDNEIFRELADYYNKDPGMAHLPDERPGLGGGGAEAWGQDCRSGREILGAGRMIQMPHSSVPTPASPFPPARLGLPVGVIGFKRIDSNPVLLRIRYFDEFRLISHQPILLGLLLEAILP